MWFRLGVHEAFVSARVLVEIEQMSPAPLRPDHRHIDYFQHVVGPVDSWHRLAPSSEQAFLWLGSKDGRPVGVVKLYRSTASAAREIHAYDRWAPSLRRWTVPFYGVPPDDPGALVLGHAPGAVGTASASADVFASAGRFAAALHGVARFDEDPVPLEAALARRLQGAFQRAGHRFGDALRLQVEALVLGNSLGLRVPCHRDFHPRNWQLDGDRVTILDFGQARPDWWLVDLVKLVFWWQPVQAKAFFEGYGRGLTPEEDRSLLGLVALHGVSSLNWAERHGLTRPRQEGERALAWFRAELGRRSLG